MCVYRYLVEILVATIKFLSNNKNLGTELFFIISDFPKFVQGNNTVCFKQGNVFF